MTGLRIVSDGTAAVILSPSLCPPPPPMRVNVLVSVFSLMFMLVHRCRILTQHEHLSPPSNSFPSLPSSYLPPSPLPVLLNLPSKALPPSLFFPPSLSFPSFFSLVCFFFIYLFISSFPLTNSHLPPPRHFTFASHPLPPSLRPSREPAGGEGVSILLAGPSIAHDR